MRVILRDFRRRKLPTTHDGDFVTSARYHMVIPMCILATILESIEMDPSSPCRLLVLYELPTLQIPGSLLFLGFQRIIS